MYLNNTCIIYKYIIQVYIQVNIKVFYILYIKNNRKDLFDIFFTSLQKNWLTDLNIKFVNLFIDLKQYSIFFIYLPIKVMF